MRTNLRKKAGKLAEAASWSREDAEEQRLEVAGPSTGSPTPGGAPTGEDRGALRRRRQLRQVEEVMTGSSHDSGRSS